MTGLLDVLEQVRRREIERFCNRLEGPQADFLSPLLKLRHVVLVDSGLFGQIDLAPAALYSQLPDPLPERHANIGCHSPNGGISSR